MSGSLLKKVKDGMDQFEDIYDILIFSLISPVGFTIGSILVISIGNIWLGLILTVWIGVYIYTQLSMYRKKGEKEDKAVSARSHRSGYLADTFANHSTIEHMGSICLEETKHDEKISDWSTKESVSRYYGNVIYAVAGLLMKIIWIGGIVLIVFLRQKNIVELSLLVLFLFYVGRLLLELRGIGNVFKRLFASLEKGREYLALLKTPHEIQDNPDAIQAQRETPTISFNTINFKYLADTESNVIEHFSLSIAPYEKIGLVGESGAGKSTLIKLLMRLYDVQEGSITIGGTDIRDFQLDSLRSAISYVPQEPILFHRSIRENILYGKPDATQEELIQATKRARAYEFITNLPHGFDSLVGERGVKLSGGQRQRVAIARAILHDADIIILDEATSALDSHTERDIQQAMIEVMQGKTAIVIAHRLSTVKNLDRLIVLDDGKIVEEGSHDVLMEQGGVYAQTVELQSGL